jgi:hypothetical protein
MSPPKREQRQIWFFGLLGGEAGRTHVVLTVADHRPLLLHLPEGVDPDEVIDLIGDFSSCFVLSLVYY